MLQALNDFFAYLGTQLLPVLLSLLLLDACNLTNMFGGLIMAWSVKQEDWHRFGQSVLKWVLINLFILCVCSVLSSITYVVGVLKIIPEDYYKVAEGIITIAEVMGVVWVTIGKYLKEVWEKLKKLLGITEEEAEKVQTTFEKYRDFQDSEEGLG